MRTMRLHLVIVAIGFGAALFHPRLAFSNVTSIGETVKTNHVSVNLWSKPGRTSAEKIDKIERYEEIQVIERRQLGNGELWYRVQLNRHPSWRRATKVGWVDAKFFVSIRSASTGDRTKPAAPADCPMCNKSNASSDGSLERQISTLKQVNDKISIRANGNSSKGFIWPAVGPLRSGFGMRRHPILGVVKLHNGIDIAGGDGTLVRAAKAGKVLASKGGCITGAKACNGGAGNFVVIDHGDGTVTKYLHLSSRCALAKPNSRVTQGESVACIGSTGASTGPHLHFSILRNGKYVNPVAGELPTESK